MKTIKVSPNRNFFTIQGNVILYCVDKKVGNKLFYAILFEDSMMHHFEYNLN